MTFSWDLDIGSPTLVLNDPLVYKYHRALFWTETMSFGDSLVWQGRTRVAPGVGLISFFSFKSLVGQADLHLILCADCVVEAGLELMIFLPPLTECWNYMCATMPGLHSPLRQGPSPEADHSGLLAAERFPVNWVCAYQVTDLPAESLSLAGRRRNLALWS